MINLPLAHSSYYGWRLDRDGVETVATVVDTRRGPPDGDDSKYFVEFRFDSGPRPRAEACGSRRSTRPPTTGPRPKR